MTKHPGTHNERPECFLFILTRFLLQLGQWAYSDSQMLRRFPGFFVEVPD